MKRSFNIQFVVGIFITLAAVLIFILSGGNMWAVPVAIVGLGLIATASKASHQGIILLVAGLCFTACRASPMDIQKGEQPDPPVATSASNLPNPASVNCQEKGYTLVIRTAEDGSQQGVCVFSDGSECDEWAYYRGECGPGSQGEAESTPTLAPTQAIDITDWSAYTHSEYGFSFRYPHGWALEEVQDSANTMSGHQIRLTTQAGEGKTVRLLIGFKRAGEEQLIWPTGVGEGDFVQKGKVLFLEQEVNRNVLVCRDQEMKVFYEQVGGVKRGDLEFSFILETSGNCLDRFSIPVEIQQLADRIVISFSV